MTKFKTLLLIAAALLSGAEAVQAATQSSTVRITIKRPVALARLRDLEFGRIAASATAGTVTIDPDTNTRSATGGAITAGGAPQTARFRVTATPGTLVLVTRNNLPVLSRTGGGASMNVTLLTMNGAANPVTIPASGQYDVDIGGVLSVAANQMDGTYSGTFQLTADYQ